MKHRFETMFQKTQQIPFIIAIRKGFIMIVPVLLIGSFALALLNLPITAYQTFLKETLFQGRLAQVLLLAYNATFGLLSLYVAIFVSISYARQYQAKVPYIYGAPLTAISCYGVLLGFGTESFDITALGAKGMFVAVLSAVLASWMYTALSQQRWGQLTLYTDGADIDFNQAFSSLAPAAMVVLFFVGCNMLLCRLFHVDSFYHLFSLAAETLFHNMGRSLMSIMLYSFLSSLLWFFGIHGSDVLDGVARSLFVVPQGQMATELFTKQFLEIFVVLGGSGATLCLLVAMLLFTRRRSNRSLARVAAMPMLFNINEVMVFGLPIVYNPYMFIPFIMTPLVLLLISAAVISMGWVPIPHFEVGWTTPILLSGYLSTGSFSGAFLQLFNLVAGTAIYVPFIRMYDRDQMQAAKKQVGRLVEILQESEETKIPVQLTDFADANGAVAKMLALDLKHAVANGGRGLDLFYQPQYNQHGRCIGCEALLRWNHPSCGMVYPPLVIKLAQEADILGDLELYILERAAQDAKVIQEVTVPQFKMSANVTSATFMSPRFEGFLSQMPRRVDIDPTTLWLEVTEQIALDVGLDADAMFQRVRDMGFHMAIDDFSMGHTSLKYLQGNQFDLVKIDGALVKEINSNPRCREIIASIVYLAGSLGFQVCAEYVENEAIRQSLEDIGCYIYQGWHYSPALPLNTFLERHAEAARKIDPAQAQPALAE